MAILLFLVVLAVIAVLWRRRKPKVVAPPRPAPGIAYLESMNRAGKPQQGAIYPSLPLTIGRGRENRLCIDESYPGWETVSKHHAEVRLADGRYILHDLQSTNGIYVNNLQSGVNYLRDGALIRFGRVEFVFHENRLPADAV